MGRHPAWRHSCWPAPPGGDARYRTGCTVTAGVHCLGGTDVTLVREHCVGESHDAPVDPDVFSLAPVEPVADLLGPGVAGISEQPLLPPGPEGRLEVVPFPLVS